MRRHVAPQPTITPCVTNVSTTGISDDEYAVARAVCADEELVDLMMAIAIMNASNRIGVGFRAPPGALAR